MTDRTAVNTAEAITTINTDELNPLSKQQLIELVIYADTLAQTRGRKPKGPGRKDQVLKVLQSGPATIDAIATIVKVSHKNISSQLSYLRKDGVKIGRNSANQLFLEA